MFSPKKESCRRRFTPGTSSAALAGDGLLAQPAHLRGRDKALPDRLVITSLVCDSIVVLYALVLSYWFRFQTGIKDLGVDFGAITLKDYSGYIAFGSIALICTLTSFGIYERTALLRFRYVSLKILKGAACWALGFLAFALIFKFQPPISRLFVGISMFLVPVSLLTWRVIFHGFLQRSVIAVNLRQRVAFVGWNKESARLSKTFSEDPSSAYQVIGCISSIPKRYEEEPTIRELGHCDNLAEIIHRHAVDMVVLTDVNPVTDDIVHLANTCEREMVQFKVIPSYFQILVSGLHLETVSGIPILGVSRLPLDRFVNIFLKRMVDIVGAVVGLILAAPIIAIFGTLVYLESPGPVIYRNRRLGRNGIEFDILKIRSMRIGAEKEASGFWTLKDDPRRLRIGAFMRRWNLDEVPQFWNVLIGDMSLVGPRPESASLIRNLKHEIPHYNARHNAKPGITGWAQVKGLRGDTDLTERINCDLWYLENWSLTLDVQIMLMTFVKHDNAG
ncbi:MAG TPA: exopolysaccharide biosynthesis polyprenyl glycosylphosphotransferase [Chthoniobacteraceae bacterium]